jgi:cytochrome c oxidase assembly factor CtaG
LDELNHCGLLDVSCEKSALSYFSALVYLVAGLLFYWIIHWRPSDAAGAGLQHTARQQPSVCRAFPP